MTRILAIDGSYREGGITDQAVSKVSEAAREGGATVECVYLRRYPLEFCLNCRGCCQQPGEAPGPCAQQDGLAELVEKIEAADGLILAAPTNAGSVTALYKRFMERLIVYTYWPWGAPSPKLRKADLPPKPALIITSSAAPAIMARWAFASHRQLATSARYLGARVIGALDIGLIAHAPHPSLPRRARLRARRLGRRLAES